MSKIVLVTGGCGFIGSHLVEALLKRGERVRVLDNLCTGLAANVSGFSQPPELIEGDVSDPKIVTSAVAGVDTIYHLAALASVQKSVEDPGATHRVCATGTLEVLDAARRAGVGRLVYAGSSSAYGVPKGPVQKEHDPLSPLSPYAAAKLAGELYAQSFSTTFGLETVRLRFFNIFGPRQRADSPYSGVIALFIRALLDDRVPTVFGDGRQTRDFTYVADVVQALLRAGSVEGISGRVYNVGTGKGVDLRELLGELNRILKKSIAPRHETARAGDVRHSRADIALARRELGFEPTVTFAEGLARTVAWYRGENPGP